MHPIMWWCWIRCLLMVLKGYIERRHLQTELCAVHVNHGIRQEAGDDEEFARALCERMGVEFMAYHIDAAGLAKQLGMSVEEAGRKERYRIFKILLMQQRSCRRILILLRQRPIRLMISMYVWEMRLF